jgi:hypothetical protein
LAATGDRLAAHRDIPRARAVDTTKHIHQRKFFNPVFREKTQYVAAMGSQIDVLVDLNRTVWWYREALVP